MKKLSNENLKATRTLINRYVRYFALNNLKQQYKEDQEFYNECRRMYFLVTDWIGLLTPREFMTIFPIDKEYDGHKYETKDYFYTMQIIKEHGIDVPIGTDVYDFLYDYNNFIVRLFTIHFMTFVDHERYLDGKKPAIFDFFNLPCYTQDEEGNIKEYKPELLTLDEIMNDIDPDLDDL